MEVQDEDIGVGGSSRHGKILESALW